MEAQSIDLGNLEVSSTATELTRILTITILSNTPDGPVVIGKLHLRITVGMILEPNPLPPGDIPATVELRSVNTPAESSLLVETQPPPPEVDIKSIIIFGVVAIVLLSIIDFCGSYAGRVAADMTLKRINSVTASTSSASTIALPQCLIITLCVMIFYMVRNYF